MPRSKDPKPIPYGGSQGDAYKEIREQLGLPIYPHTEAVSKAVEIPRSERPDISAFSDIDVSQRNGHRGGLLPQPQKRSCQIR